MSVQATFAATLVDEWVDAGVTDAVVCPGSRSTPLALALAARLRVHVRLDERSAGFFAIGLAMASGTPYCPVCHQRYRRRRAPPRGGGGPSGAGAPHCVHGRPAARAPSRGGVTDHRPGGAVHHVDPLVLRPWRPGGVPGRIVAAAGRPRGCRGPGRAARTRAGPSEPRLSRTAHRLRRPVAGPAGPVARPVPPGAGSVGAPARRPRADHCRSPRQQRPRSACSSWESASGGRSWPIPDPAAA